MSFNSMLTDLVNIHKLKTQTEQSRYGVPPKESYYYDEQADYSDVRCSVQSSGWKSQIVQNEPHIEVQETLKAIFTMNVDITLNDKVVFNGADYRAKVPRYIRNHHIEVEIERFIDG